jgi:predicted double-glycine peptidase
MLLNLKDIRQEYSYDCGPAAVESILEYFGIGCNDIAKVLGTTENGTSPDALIRGLAQFSQLRTIAGPMTIHDLDMLTSKGWPVLCCIQYGGEGHWVVVRGVIKGHVCYQCPREGRQEVLEDEWLKDWWDVDFEDQTWRQFGCGVCP